MGISADEPSTHKKFETKYDLPYRLLSDRDKKVAEQFGVIKEKNLYGRKVKGIARTTFIIDAAGKIAHVFENVKPEGHGEEVIAELKQQKKQENRVAEREGI